MHLAPSPTCNLDAAVVIPEPCIRQRQERCVGGVAQLAVRACICQPSRGVHHAVPTVHPAAEKGIYLILRIAQPSLPDDIMSRLQMILLVRYQKFHHSDQGITKDINHYVPMGPDNHAGPACNAAAEDILSRYTNAGSGYFLSA